MPSAVLEAFGPCVDQEVAVRPLALLAAALDELVHREAGSGTQGSGTAFVWGPQHPRIVRRIMFGGKAFRLSYQCGTCVSFGASFLVFWEAKGTPSVLGVLSFKTLSKPGGAAADHQRLQIQEARACGTLTLAIHVQDKRLLKNGLKPFLDGFQGC